MINRLRVFDCKKEFGTSITASGTTWFITSKRFSEHLCITWKKRVNVQNTATLEQAWTENRRLHRGEQNNQHRGGCRQKIFWCRSSLRHDVSLPVAVNYSAAEEWPVVGHEASFIVISGNQFSRRYGEFRFIFSRTRHVGSTSKWAREFLHLFWLFERWSHSEATNGPCVYNHT